jgi:hypothetical protein
MPDGPRRAVASGEGCRPVKSDDPTHVAPVLHGPADPGRREAVAVIVRDGRIDLGPKAKRAAEGD